jgi:hypothetical protein
MEGNEGNILLTVGDDEDDVSRAWADSDRGY